MGKVSFFNGIMKPFSVRPVKFLCFLFGLLMISSASNLFAQCPPVPTISETSPLTFCSGDSVVFTSSAGNGNQWFRDGNKINGATQTTFTATTAGSYTVQLTSGVCIVNSSPSVVTVNPSPPKPTINANGPVSFCSNDSVVLTSSATNGNQWLFNGANIKDSIIKTLTVKSTGSYNVRVTAGGCSTTSDTTKVNVINVQAPPTITAVGPLTFCSGDSVVFTSSAGNGNQWFRDGNKINGATQATFTAITAGSYTVQLASGICIVNSAPSVVTVNPSPTKPTITPGGPTNFCSNDSVVLTSSATNGNQWLLNGANIKDSIIKTLTVKSTGSYNVRVTAGGCSTTSDTTKVNVINVQAPPTITAVGPLTFCSGDSVVFTSSAGNGNQWFRDGNKINGATQATFTATTAGSYTVQLASGVCIVNSAPTVVAVNPSPLKPTINANGPLSFCSNDSVVLTSSATNGNQWLLNGANIKDSIIKTLTVKSTGSYNVRVTAGGCSTTSDTTKVNVVNVQAPATITASGPLTFCSGDSVVFTSSVVNGNQWFRNGNKINGAVLQTFTARNAGTYFVQLASGACTVNSAPSVVTVNLAPAKPTINANGPLSFCSNDSVQLSSSANTGNQWLLNGKSIQDSIFRTLTVKKSGYYNVLVTANGCSSTSDTTKVNVINVQAPPTITASGPLTFCSGDSVVFTSSVTNGNQWFRDGNKINGAVLQTFTATTAGSYTVQLASGVCIVNSAPSVVTVNPSPTKPTINANGPLSFCSNDSVVLTSSATNGNQWLLNGANIKDSIIKTLTVKSTGSYNVRVTAGGCSTTSDTTKVNVVNVQAPPSITASGPLTFCSGDSVVFTSSAGNGNQWFRDGNKINGATQTTFTATTAGSYTVQLTSGVCIVNSSPSVVTVNPSPPKPTINANGPVSFCSNDSVVLTSSATNGNQWLFNGANIKDSIIKTLTVKSTGSYNVRVTAGGCSTTSDTTKVNVINVQAPPTITASGPLTFCSGDSVVFTSSAGNGNQWFRDGKKINKATQTTFTATTAGSYTVQLASGVCTVNSAPSVVTVNPSPAKPTINANGPLSFCSNDSVVLTSSATNGNQWLLNGANIKDSIIKTLTVKSTGSYNVRVTAGGCSTTSDTTKVNVINVQAPPTITAVGPLTFCSGDSVVFTSSAGNGNQWFRDGNKINGAVLQTFTATTAGSYTVQLASGVCIVNSAPSVVTVNPSPPKPTINANGPLSFCSNDSVVLTSSATNGNQWLLNGANIKDSIIKTLTVKSTGSYNVRVTAGGCSTTSDTTKVNVVNVQAPPTITASGPLTFCSGDSVVFTSSVANGNQWFRDGNKINGAVLQTFTATTAGSYTVQLASGVCIVNSAPSVVTVNLAPAKPTINANGPLSFCSNDSVQLSSSANTGNQWLLNGKSIQDSIFRTLTVKKSGSYNVLVTANGCSSTSDTTKVNVINVQAPPTITASGPLTFCSGDSVVFTSSVANGNQWFRNGNKINGAVLQTFTARNAGTYFVQLASGACTVNSAPSVVTVNLAPPKPTITPGGPTNFCSNDSVGLSSSSDIGNQWLLNDSSIKNSILKTLTVKTSGSYRVLVTIGTCSTLSDTIAIAVINIQQPPTISANRPLSFCSTDSVVFTSTAPGGNQWLRNGTVIIGATLQTYSAKIPGSYSVQLASGGCTINSNVLVVTAVNPVPAIPVITSNGPTTLCSNDSLTLTSSAAMGNQWIRDGNIIPDSVSTTLLVRIAGTYKVMVTNAGGCSAISDSIKVTVPNVQTRPTVTPDGPLTFCDGDSVVFISTLASGNQWFRNGVAINGATRQSYIAKTFGSYSVQLSGGGACAVSSVPLVVTVNPQPAKPLINANGPTTFCNNDSVGLSSSSLTGNQWIKDGVNITDSVSPTLMVRASGSYQVKVTGAGGCASVSNALSVVEINNLIPPEITPARVLTICSGGNVTLTSSSVSGNQWFFNNNLIVGAVLQTFPATLAGIYTVRVSSQAGCSATSLPKIVSAGVTPVTPLTTLADTLINCVYSKVLYSSSANGNQWLRNGVAVDGETHTYYIVNTTGSYSVQVTSVSGCMATSTSNTILVIANPNTPVITTTDLLSFCDGGSALLNASTAPGYQWYKDGALINGATSQNFTANASGAYTVQVVSDGCSFSSQAVNVSVINNQTPATITPAGPISVCGGQTTVLSSSSASGNQWYKDGVAIVGANNQTYSVSEAGSYTVKITVGTCNSLFSTPVVVNSTQSQTAPTVTAGGPLSFCTGGSVTLTASAATSYQWYKDGTAIPNETNPSYTATMAGTYTVQIKNASACQAVSEGVVVTISSSSAAPSISTAGSGPGCGAGQTVLISSSDLGNQWLKDGNAIPGAIQKTYSTDVGGNYSVALDYGSACFSESQTVTIIGNNISAILNASIKNVNGFLTSDSAKGNQWYLNDTLIAGATDNTFIPQVPGKYTLRITNSNGCLSRFSDPYFVKLENFSSPNVFMFPNPVVNDLFIVNLGSNPVTARVFDVQGRQLMMVRNMTGTNQINLSKLSTGTYVVQVIDDVTNDKTRNLILKY